MQVPKNIETVSPENKRGGGGGGGGGGNIIQNL